MLFIFKNFNYLLCTLYFKTNMLCHKFFRFHRKHDLVVLYSLEMTYCTSTAYIPVFFETGSLLKLIII